ncbi:Virus X resistance protein-like, coiled-coil domain [Sesbania bispinosa]|nr:Virus X resistance protein-like, coiled-coil domain [Sesbania bispinosa]
MAEIVLCPLLQAIFERVTCNLLKLVAEACGFEDEVDKLRRALRHIQPLLEDAEQQQASHKALKLWLTELRGVAYDADDLLDEFSLNRCSDQLPPANGFWRHHFVSNAVSSFRSYAVYLELFPKLKRIRQNLDVLVCEMSSFHLKEVSIKGLGGRRQTGSFIINTEVFGRKKDKEKILELILKNEGNQTPGAVPVIPIVGLGGIGKTTLAQLTYNDDRVTRGFDLRIWVSVNEDFYVRDIIRSIIESVTKRGCEIAGMDVLQCQLRDLLQLKRYLLVLDDLWSEDHDEWDKLRILLSGCAQGSKILVTTRSEKVASIMGTVSPYYLKSLSDEDCLELFKQRAFIHGEECDQKLMPIGKEIVKKCGGLPLAAKTLGSLMRLKRDEREWLCVKESELWNVLKDENGILPALRLSYSHLPSHLKGCLMYCSIFPKNYVIEKKKLILMWVAQGLIQSPEGEKSLEDIGDEYFKELMWIFFFEVVKRSSDGDVIECRLHNLVHDLLQLVSGTEFVITESSCLPRYLSQTRHTSVVSDFGAHVIPENLYEAKKLRSLHLLFPKDHLGEGPANWFSEFKYLRVLNLSGSGIKRLHDSISSLISLRHLDLSHTAIETLPETLCCPASKLQVLDLTDCCELIELPMGLYKLFNLRHLMINGCDRLSHMPEHIGRLVQLQTLPVFIAGTEASKSLTQLQRLKLKGELHIKQMEHVKQASEARVTNFRGKPQLHSLSLSWKNYCEDLTMRNEFYELNSKEVLECIEPNQNLKSLCIQGYPGICFPRWIGDIQLPNLTKMMLINCRRCEYLPSLGKFPFLNAIHLQGMHSVINIGREFYGGVSGSTFQSLQELSIVDFPNSEFWWSLNNGEEFPSLVKLTIKRCPKLKNMPSIQSLQHLELQKCDDMILLSASNISSLSTLVIDQFTGQLVPLENLLQNNASLTSLTISSCQNLPSIPSTLGCLTALKSLTIRWCEELLTLPEDLQKLSSLECLELSECHSLVALPEGIQGLHTLRSLSIENCNSITSLPCGLQHLTVLEHLAIMYCPVLDHLPAELSNLSMLRSLYILSCPKLSFLPESLKHVTSLQTLEIHSCPELRVLPRWIDKLAFLRSLVISDCHNIESLPEGLRHLSNLQHLSIHGCSTLEEECRKGVGRDWPKIAHIPYTYVGKNLELSTESSSTH